MGTVNRQWLLAKRPEGLVGPDNFTLHETEAPAVESAVVSWFTWNRFTGTESAEFPTTG